MFSNNNWRIISLFQSKNGWFWLEFFCWKMSEVAIRSTSRLSLCCHMRNSDEMAIGKAHPTFLHFKLVFFEILWINNCNSVLLYNLCKSFTITSKFKFTAKWLFDLDMSHMTCICVNFVSELVTEGHYSSCEHVLFPRK